MDILINLLKALRKKMKVFYNKLIMLSLFVDMKWQDLIMQLKNYMKVFSVLNCILLVPAYLNINFIIKKYIIMLNQLNLIIKD